MRGATQDVPCRRIKQQCLRTSGDCFPSLIPRDFDTQRVGLRVRSRDRSACGKSLTTVPGVFLLAWTAHCPVRTKYTAIAGFRTQDLFTVCAFIEVLTGIDWHDLFLAKPAQGACDGRMQCELHHKRKRLVFHLHFLVIEHPCRSRPNLDLPHFLQVPEYSGTGLQPLAERPPVIFPAKAAINEALFLPLRSHMRFSLAFDESELLFEIFGETCGSISHRWQTTAPIRTIRGKRGDDQMAIGLDGV
jgi:hypothetical protein